MKNTRKFYAFIIAIIMLTSSFMMMFGNISFAMEPEIEPGAGEADAPTFNVDFGTAAWTVNGTQVTVSILYHEVLNDGPVELEENDLIRVNNFNPDTMEILLTGENNFTTHLDIVTENNETSLACRDAENLPNSVLTFAVVAKQNNNNNNNNPQPPAGGPDNLEFDIKFEDTHMIIQVNNVTIIDDAEGDLKDSFKGTINGAGVANADGTNTFKFQNVFGDKPVKEYVINGVTYKEGSAGVVIGEDGLYTITVPGAAKYTITGVGDPDAVVPRTIIWVNPDYKPKDENDAQWVKDFTIEHGYAKVIEVYDENGKKLDPKDYINNTEQPDGTKSDNYGLNNGFGWVQVFKGYKVVFELEPEYGYQLTQIAINESPLEAIDDVVNRFEVIIPDGNLHFAATYSKTEDIVKTGSKKVSEGKIELANNTLGSGTAQLTVNDVELDAEKLKGFEGAAKGAEIKNVLDIDLYQVFYKGKNDSVDVWSNQIEELDGEAEITLKLGDDVDVREVVLVHNIHDGEEYEVIEIIRYDVEAHTITFRTKSFSNYAIATKPVEKTQITLTDATTKAVISFEDADGHKAEDFEFMTMDITNLTDAQIAELGIPKTEYEKGLEKIKEASKEYGGLIVLYNIQVRIPKEDRDLTDGPFELKIPQTDALKGYESIKIAYVDSEDFTLKEITELKLEDGYYVGTLKHLSPYALLGKAIEKTETNGNNPSTGDNIVVFGSIFVLSALAIAFEVIVIKKSKLYR